jgi:4-amino-4-deoxy-L-arabinose transferase-like glycosyltransferase
VRGYDRAAMNPSPVPLDPRQRRELWWFLAIAFVVLAAGIGLRQPWPSDEPRFVLVAKQMWESGDWWFPHRGAELYPDKPPLYFWLLGASYAVVRSWTWAFLLPSLFAAMATLAMTWDLGRRLWSPRAGLWAAVAVLCALQFLYQSKRAQIDPTEVALITLGMYGLLRHLLLGPQWRWYWIGCFAAGLGVIAKGVGFLPLLALLPYAAMRWRGWNQLPDPGRGNGWRWALGAFAFLGAIALWLLPMVAMALNDGDAQHRAYLGEILFKQTAGRYASSTIHPQPAWYFLEVIALFWMPFSLALPWLAPRWRDAWRERSAKVWLPLAWALLVLLFFSLSHGKRDMYILPALPMVALAAAPYLPGIAAKGNFRAWLFALVAALAALFLVAGAWALAGDPKFEAKIEAERGLAPGSDALWWLLAATGAAMLAALAFARRHLLASVATALGLMVVLLFCGTAVLLDDANSARGLMRAARAQAGPNIEIGLVGWREQQLLQAVGPVAEFGFRQPWSEQLRRGAEWMAQSPRRRMLLVNDEAMQPCIDRAHVVEAGRANRRSWWLVSQAAVVSRCTTGTIATDDGEED